MKRQQSILHFRAEDLAHEMLCDIEKNKRITLVIWSTVKNKKDKYHFEATITKLKN